MMRRLTFIIPPDVAVKIHSFLGKLGCQKGLRQAKLGSPTESFEFTFESEDTRFSTLETVLQEHRETRWFKRVEHLYSDSELQRFPLLSVTVTSASLSVLGPKCGTTYDLTAACQRCGTGAVQTSPFFLPAGRLPKKRHLITASHEEMFLTDDLAKLLREERVSGIELRQALGYRTHQPLPWWQLIARTQMPRVSAISMGIIRSSIKPPCPVCLQDGYYGTAEAPMELAYSKSEVEISQLPDVVHTWERTGSSNPVASEELGTVTRYAPPIILVKPRVFDLLRRQGVKNIAFRPVRIVE